jgi:RNA polymerase sigma factor (sigma-70 family)
MEASTLTHTGTMAGLRGPSPLLRLQSDERLVALTRAGQHAAFEALCTRYQSRLLSFCRHMLNSREDAEDVLQEVFAAAFNAILADQREINVRPWLYRIARNRSLNHLRRASAVGVDSMDVHYADHGLSTGDRVIRRESFRELLGDVRGLPETQRTALLLREIDALSYEQIADAMETTVPSVKSLLVRARISLAEAAEARKLSCEEVRLELGEVAEGLVKLSPPARRHVRECDRCRSFKKQLKENNHALAAILPVGPLLVIKKLVLAKLGSASAGSAHVAGGAGATVGASAAAGAGATGGAGAAGGIFTVGAGALATKAVAGLAAAAIVGAGAVAADQSAHHRHHSHAVAASAPLLTRAEPVVAAERSQPVSLAARVHPVVAAHRAVHHPVPPTLKPVPAPTAAATSSPAAPVPAPTETRPAPQPQPEDTGTQVTQVTSETTELPASATQDPQSATTATSTSATPPPPPPANPTVTGGTEAAPAGPDEATSAADTAGPAQEQPASAQEQSGDSAQEQTTSAQDLRTADETPAAGTVIAHAALTRRPAASGRHLGRAWGAKGLALH